MLSTGIPELQSQDDINHLREALFLNHPKDPRQRASDSAAGEFFKVKIKEALDCRTTQFNDMAHIIAHRK